MSAPFQSLETQNIAVRSTILHSKKHKLEIAHQIFPFLWTSSEFSPLSSTTTGRKKKRLSPLSCPWKTWDKQKQALNRSDPSSRMLCAYIHCCTHWAGSLHLNTHLASGSLGLASYCPSRVGFTSDDKWINVDSSLWIQESTEHYDLLLHWTRGLPCRWCFSYNPNITELEIEFVCSLIASFLFLPLSPQPLTQSITFCFEETPSCQLIGLVLVIAEPSIKTWVDWLPRIPSPIALLLENLDENRRNRRK